jgi:hypothetical protein
MAGLSNFRIPFGTPDRIDIEKSVRAPSDSPRGAPSEANTWVTERTAVPCRIRPVKADIEDLAERRTGTIKHKLYFETYVLAGTDRRFVYRDPDTDAVRYLYPVPARRPASEASVWVVEAIEYT